MALRTRMEITPTRVRVFKANGDTAFDSDWPRVERIHHVKTIKGTSLRQARVINFTPLHSPPYGVLVQRDRDGWIYDIPVHDRVMSINNGVRDVELFQTYRIEYVTTREARISQAARSVGSDTQQTYNDKKFDFIFIAIEA